MKIKPILFSGDMVRALLDNRKTVTRRVMKPQPADTDCEHEMVTFDQMLPEFYEGDYSCVCRKCGYGAQPNGESVFQPPYCPGDILYVRETFCEYCLNENSRKGHSDYCYKASIASPVYGCIDHYSGGVACKWRPSIHMPREAARIFLRVTKVYPQQLKDVTEDDAKAEGFAYRAEFVTAILKMYPDCTEDSWFWANEFERISKEEAEKNA